jgi:hypothetical protein
MAGDIKTVGDLIAALQKLPPDRPVLMMASDDYETTLWVDDHEEGIVWIKAGDPAGSYAA